MSTTSLLTLAFLAVVPTVEAQPSLVILVRHAERAAAPTNDPGLTEAGAQRAADLLATLKDAGVTAIVTTHLQRTQLTAGPIATARALTPIVVRAGGPTQAHVDSVAAVVKRRPAGDVVLVVGHSNTIPAIVGSLGGPRLPDLCDSEYSTLFILEYPAAGPPRLVRAKYGAPDPPNADGCRKAMGTGNRE